MLNLNKLKFWKRKTKPKQSWDPVLDAAKVYGTKLRSSTTTVLQTTHEMDKFFIKPLSILTTLRTFSNLIAHSVINVEATNDQTDIPPKLLHSTVHHLSDGDMKTVNGVDVEQELIEIAVIDVSAELNVETIERMVQMITEKQTSELCDIGNIMNKSFKMGSEFIIADSQNIKQIEQFTMSNFDDSFAEVGLVGHITNKGRQIKIYQKLHCDPFILLGTSKNSPVTYKPVCPVVVMLPEQFRGRSISKIYTQGKFEQDFSINVDNIYHLFKP
jgi:hypothetical protein